MCFRNITMVFKKWFCEYENKPDKEKKNIYVNFYIVNVHCPFLMSLVLETLYVCSSS